MAENGTEPETPQEVERRLTAPPAGDEGAGNVKDTVDSILIALILAFIFRAFVVEAFVIPTGSMAPTLLGAHMRLRCKDCGYQWDVNFRGRTVGDDLRIPQSADIEEVVNGVRVVTPRVFSLRCPNCGYKVAREDKQDPENDATSPPVRYGDRILVLKYLYLFEEPRRWDVVVFKTPWLRTDDAGPPYTINYIKRLAARPGETVAVLDGDVYVKADHGEKTPWVIQTKPRAAQEALWRVVYDNDYLPRGLPRQGGIDYEHTGVRAFTQPWRVSDGAIAGERGWKLDGSTSGDARIFTFDDAGGSGTITFDPDAQKETHAFTDWLAYDVTSPQQPDSSVRETADTYDTPDNMARNAVSDLKLAMTYERREGEGPLRLMLTKRGHTFTAELTPAKARLLHRTPAGEEWVVAEADRITPHERGAERVEFMNVDYQVTLRVDGQDVIRTTPRQYAPDLDGLVEEYKRRRYQPIPMVQVSAERQRCAVSHLGLWRDVYYTSRNDYGSALRWGNWDSPVKLYRKGQAIGADDPRYSDLPVKVATDDEYFVLGDNSIISGDARWWDNPVDLPEEKLYVGPGCVPGRFMLGKAFFVYWPAGFRPFGIRYAVCPNFGEMRVIQ